mgnify:CR=1 FL=1
MPLPANPSQRMSNRDTVQHSLKFLLFAISSGVCLLYTSDAAADGLGVDVGGRRFIK